MIVVANADLNIRVVVFGLAQNWHNGLVVGG